MGKNIVYGKRDFSKLLRGIRKQQDNIEETGDIDEKIYEERYFDTGIKQENALGYCHYYKHKGYVNEHILKTHECLNKQCPLLEKYEDKSYWIKRKIIKVLKTYHKNNSRGRIRIGDKEYITDNLERLFNIYRRHMDIYGEHPEIVWVSPEEISSRAMYQNLPRDTTYGVEQERGE